MKKILIRIVLLSVIFVGMISCDKKKDTEFKQITETYEGTLTLTSEYNLVYSFSDGYLNSIPFSNVHLTVTKIAKNKAVFSFVEDELLFETQKLDVDGEKIIFHANFFISNSFLDSYALYPITQQMLFYTQYNYDATLNNNTVTYTNDENGYAFSGTTTVQNEDSEITGNVVNQQININFSDIIHFVGEKIE